MKKEIILKTKFAKEPIIFTIIGLLSSIAVITLCAIFGQGNPLAIVAIIFFAIIVLAAIILLFGELLDYAYICDGYLYMIYIFKRGKILIKDISTVKLENNIYTVFDKKEKREVTLMVQIFGFFGSILGYLLWALFYVFQNFGVSIIFFTSFYNMSKSINITCECC